MDTSPNSLRSINLATTARVASTIAAGIGSVVFISWLLNISSLKSLVPGWATMKANTALVFMLAALVLWMLQKEDGGQRRRLLTQICIMLIALIAILTLLEYIGGWDFKIDQLVIKDTSTSSAPGRMSSGTAFAFFLIAISLWFLQTRQIMLAQLLATLVFFITLLALIGYVYDVSSLYKTTIYASMALHTALTLFLICIGVFFTYPKRGLMIYFTADSLGGISARRLLPAAILVPFVIGWLRLEGEKNNLYETEFGTALLTISASIIFTILITWNTYSLSRINAERQRVSQSLQQIQSRFVRTIEAAMDAIIVVDSDQHIIIFNNAAELMFGYQSHEMIAQSLDRLIPKRFNDMHQQHIRDFGVTGVTNRRMGALGGISGVRANGEEFPIEASISQIEQDDQKFFTVILRDITGRLQVEENLRRLNEELEAIVEQRTAHLQSVNKELEAFSYSVSHDLRAPLRAIDGFSQALLEDYTDQLDDDGKNYLNRVRVASQRMGQLIDDLIKLSRISRGDLQRTTVNLSQIGQEIVTVLKDSDPTRDVEFVLQESLTVEGDGHLLKVLLENLIGNAWKYTSKKPQARIEFGKNVQNNQSVYFVRDDGAGFDMDYAEKLFGAFQRLHTGNEFEGTGIGLATCKRILHRHGGNIWAEAKVGEGATFYFVL
jgi:PAS domain S-box-containing protein